MHTNVASYYRKPTLSQRPMDTVNHAIAVDGNTRRITLDKNHFTLEHRITFAISAAFGAAEQLPTGWDSRLVIDNIKIEMKNGNEIYLNGWEAVNSSRIQGGSDYEVFSLGTASTASFCLDLTHVVPNTIHDLVTAVQSSEIKTFDLVITFSNTLGFIGGVSAVPANKMIAIDVDSMFMGDLDANAPGARADVAMFFYKQTSSRKVYQGAGDGERFKLETVGSNRMFMVSCYDLNVDGSLTPNDAILSKLVFKVGDEVKREFKAFVLKAETARVFDGFDEPGVYVIDFGPDDRGWPNLKDVAEAALFPTAAAGAPASWVMSVAQFQVVEKDKLNK